MEKQDTEKVQISLNNENPKQLQDINQNGSLEQTFTVTQEELEAIKEEFLAERQKLEEEKWLELNIAKFNTLLAQNSQTNFATFSENIITYLANIFGAETIVFFDYQSDTETLIVQASYGTASENIEKNSFKLGEGLIGQVAKSKETFNLVQGISQLIIYPLIFQESLQAVIEINLKNKLIPKSKVLLQKLLENTASSTNISKSIVIEDVVKEEISTSFGGQNAIAKSQEELALEINRLKKILIEKQNDEKALLKRIAIQKEEVYEAEEKLNNYQSNHQNPESPTPESTSTTITEKEEINDLKEELEWKVAEIERQDNAINHKKKLIEEAEKQIEKLKQENHKQVEEIVASSKSFKEIEQDMNLMRSTHKQELENHQRTIQRLEEEVEKQEEKYQQKIKEVEETWSVSVQERIVESQSKSSDLVELEEQLKQVKVAEESIKKELEELKIDQQKNILELEDSIKQKDSQVEDYKKEIGDIQQVLNEKLSLEEKLKEDISFKNDEIKQLKQSIEQKKIDKPTVDVSDSQTDEITSEEIAILKRRIAALEQEIVKKEQMILELSQQDSEGQSGNIDIKDLQDQLAQQEGSFNFLQDELQKRNQENAHLEEALNELREKLYDREKKLEELKASQENIKEVKEIAINSKTNKRSTDSATSNEQLEYLMWKSTAMMSFNLEAEILEVNILFAKIFEYEVNELQNESLGTLVDKEYTRTDEYKRLWYNISRGHEAQITAFKIRTKSEEVKDLNISFTPISNSEGSIERVLMLIKDPSISLGEPEVVEKIVEVEKVVEVEKIVEVEKEIREDEDTQHLLHEQTEKLKAVDNSLIILELDTEGIIKEANIQFLELLEYELENVIERSHRLLIDPEDRKNENYLQILKDAEQGKSSNKLLKYMNKEGKAVYLQSHFNPIKDETGVVRTILLISQLVEPTS